MIDRKNTADILTIRLCSLQDIKSRKTCHTCTVKLSTIAENEAFLAIEFFKAGSLPLMMQPGLNC